MEQLHLFYTPPRKKPAKTIIHVREVPPAYWSDLDVLSVILGAEAARGLYDLVEGNLFNLHGCEPEQLCEISGLGPAKAQALMAALELNRRIARSKRPKRPRFTSPQDAATFLMEEMRDNKKEYFKTILLNTKGLLISLEDISVGDLNSSIVHPREIFSPAIKKSAAAIILAHNHPSGDPSPSREDMDVTARLVEGGKILGIKVFDHIVIGDNEYVSFKERGLLE